MLTHHTCYLFVPMTFQYSSHATDQYYVNIYLQWKYGMTNTDFFLLPRSAIPELAKQCFSLPLKRSEILCYL